MIIAQQDLNGVERTLFKPIQPPILGKIININVLSDFTNQGMTKNYGGVCGGTRRFFWNRFNLGTFGIRCGLFYGLGF